MPCKFDSDYSFWTFGASEVTDEQVASAERTLGLTLPQAYVNLLRVQNGGVLKTSRFTHVPGYSEISDRGIWCIYGIGIGDEGGLDTIVGDETFNQFLIRQWGYPPQSLVFGRPMHGGFALNYSLCGPTGEPTVTYTDAESGSPAHYKAAPDFATFLSALTDYDFLEETSL